MAVLSKQASRIFRSQDTYAIGFLGVWAFVLYGTVTIGQQVLSATDIFRLFLPLRIELMRALGEGRLPLWTPFLQAGFPLFAEGEVAALYPFNLVFQFLLPAQIALSYSILFHLGWASVGMYLLARSTGYRVSSALLGGFCFGFSGFMLAHLQHAPHLAVGSWLPWLVLCQQRYWHARLNRRNSVHWFALSSLAIALQLLAGFPQMALLNLGTFAVLGVFGPTIWQQSAGPRSEDWLPSGISVVQSAAVTLASILLGLGMAAIQLLPTLELLGFSIRAQETGSNFFTSFSLDPAALTQFISPFTQLGEPAGSNMEYWAYLGILPLLLALLAPLLRRDTRTGVFVALGFAALALALGESNPVYQWLYYVPIFNRFRVPARFLFPFTFAAAFLAATGFQELQNRLRDSATTRGARTLGAVIAIGVAGAVVLGYSLPAEFWMDAWHWLPLVLALLGIGMLLVAKWRWIPRPIFATIAIGVTVFDLTIFSFPFLSLNRMVLPSDSVSVPRTVQVMDSRQSVYRAFSNNFPSMSVAAARAALWPDFSLQYGKQGVDIYAPLEFERVKEYIDAMNLTTLNLMNVRYYLLPLEVVPPSVSSPLGETEPYSGLTLRMLSEQPAIPLTNVSQIEVTSYTDQSVNLPDGFVAGEIVLGLEDGDRVTLPIRLGVETADWAFDGLAEIGKINHNKPEGSVEFPAFLSSVGREFDGHKYVAHLNVAPNSSPLAITSVGARSFLPSGGLTIEKISLIDNIGRSVSLVALLHRNELALAFRSHTAAMWENQSVMPRAFIVHEAEYVKDEQTLTRMTQSDFDPGRTVLLGDAPASRQESGVEQPRGDEVVITEYRSERVVLQAKTGSAGYLVLADTWYPGWEAKIDGASVPIQRADYIFRAVALPPGAHTVVFEYHPISFILGAVISGLTILVCVGIVGASWFRSSRFQR